MSYTPEEMLSAVKGVAELPSDERAALAGTASACSVIVLALLTLLDFEKSFATFGTAAHFLVLLAGGAVCLLGERAERAQTISDHHSFIRDHFGFALSPAGRGVFYLLVLMHCIGVRGEEFHADHALIYKALWWGGSMALVAGAGTSLWSAWGGAMPSMPGGSLLRADADPDSGSYQPYSPPSGRQQQPPEGDQLMDLNA